MQVKKRKHVKKDKKAEFSLFATLAVLCLILIGTGLTLPYVVQHHKEQSLDTHFYLNRKTNLAQFTERYKPFWIRYDVVLAQRADADGNKIISVQEKSVFDKGFFGELGLTVDQATRTITKLDGTYPNEDALMCRLNSYYPDQPWVHPVCPDL